MSTECKDCKFREGNCGNHFISVRNGSTNYDIPSLSACDKYGNCMFFKPKEKLQGDLISREALRKAINNAYKEYDGYDPNDLMRFAERVDTEIDNAPTFLSIPDNPTNGDMIKALFQNRADFNGGEGAYFNKDWWEAPYKEADNE